MSAKMKTTVRDISETARKPRTESKIAMCACCQRYRPMVCMREAQLGRHIYFFCQPDCRE